MKSLSHLEVNNEYFVNIKLLGEYCWDHIFKLKYVKKYDNVGLIEIFDISKNETLKKYFKLDDEFILVVIEKIDKKHLRSDKIKILKDEE